MQARHYGGENCGNEAGTEALSSRGPQTLPAGHASVELILARHSRWLQGSKRHPNEREHLNFRQLFTGPIQFANASASYPLTLSRPTTGNTDYLPCYLSLLLHLSLPIIFHNHSALLNTSSQ